MIRGVSVLQRFYIFRRVFGWGHEEKAGLIPRVILQN